MPSLADLLAQTDPSSPMYQVLQAAAQSGSNLSPLLGIGGVQQNPFAMSGGDNPSAPPATAQLSSNPALLNYTVSQGAPVYSGGEGSVTTQGAPTTTFNSPNPVVQAAINAGIVTQGANGPAVDWTKLPAAGPANANLVGPYGAISAQTPGAWIPAGTPGNPNLQNDPHQHFYPTYNDPLYGNIQAQWTEPSKSDEQWDRLAPALVGLLAGGVGAFAGAPLIGSLFGSALNAGETGSINPLSAGLSLAGGLNPALAPFINAANAARAATQGNPIPGALTLARIFGGG